MYEKIDESFAVTHGEAVCNFSSIPVSLTVSDNSTALECCVSICQHEILANDWDEDDVAKLLPL